MEQNRNQTPRANRIHIGFFGRRNAGKSSLINAVAKGGMPKGGTPFGALLHPFGAYQKDGVARGRNPAGHAPGAVPRQAHGSAQNTVPVASK